MWRLAWSAGSVGIEIAVAIVIGYFGGQFLDTKFGSTPWLKWIGFCAGFGAAIKALLRVTRMYRRQNNDENDGPSSPS